MFTIGHKTNLKAERKQCLGKIYDFYGTGIESPGVANNRLSCSATGSRGKSDFKLRSRAQGRGSDRRSG